jgi:hypothetical protein
VAGPNDISDEAADADYGDRGNGQIDSPGEALGPCY